MIKTSKQTEIELQKLGYHLEPNKKAIDVVCGMELEQAEHASKYRSEVYYFCSRHCKSHFYLDPEKYIGEEIY